MNLIRRGRPRRRSTSEERILVKEAEQFLSGDYACSLLLMGAPVPAWAWLDLLVHTSEDRLEARMAELLTLRRADPVCMLWQGAVALLIQELRDVSEQSGCRVGDLQEALVDELEARSGNAAAVLELGPSRFILEVRSVLERCQDGTDR
jgi:hypothetical protein